MSLILLKDMKREPCHDCGCKVGENHQPGCDTERCPKCKGQLISCDCFRIGDNGRFDEKAYQKAGPEKWSGIMYEEAHKYCEEHELFCYLDNGWVKCDRNHPQASHNLNAGVAALMMKRTK